MSHDPGSAVGNAARRAARDADAPLLLAVSGGLDSMAMLHAVASVARARIAAVATFDHGSGPAATAAAAHVARTAESLGLAVVQGRMGAEVPTVGGREATWRRARYAFLRATASSLGARIATAHTRDDQVETVLMRIMRGSGARGLAGLAAPSDVRRPLLEVTRTELREYVQAHGVAWVEDPGNGSRAHLRNRVRLDLLPALRRVRPGIDEELLACGDRAAEWRREVEAFVDARLETRVGAGVVAIARTELAAFDRDSLGMLWAALAGRLGLALDRRGTDRLAAFITSDQRGSVPLSGGWLVESRGAEYLLRRRLGAHDEVPVALPTEGAVRWGAFRFSSARVVEAGASSSSWTADLPAGSTVVVRQWSAGDRLTSAGGQRPRRVKRYLSDAGVRGLDRAGWPVVVAGDDVIWIPGVRRSDAATARSGRPVRHYVCERIDR